MRGAALMIACLWVALGVSPAAAAPLAAYGRLPSIEEVALSPSGNHLAVVLTKGEERLIGVTDLSTGKAIFRIQPGPQKVRGVMWAGEQHLLVITSATAAPMFLTGGRREWMMAQSIDIGTGKAHRLMGDVDMAMNTIFGTPVVRRVGDSDVVFVEGVTYAKSNHGHLSVFRIDPASGISRMVEDGSEETRGWVIGPDGQVVAQQVYEPGPGRWSLRVKAPVGWRTAFSQVAPLDSPYLVGLGRDPGSVIYATQNETHHWTWREVHVDGSPASDPAAAAEDQGAIHDPLTGKLIGSVAMYGDDLRYVFFDPADDKMWKDVLKIFPGDQVRLYSVSADRRHLVVEVDSAKAGPAFALVDLKARSAAWIGSLYNELTEADIAVKRAIAFKAADGMELHGYLTLPRGKPEKALPLIVFPHGGPAARDGPGFDWWAQAMASRGYAVLQVNYRGSSGLGPALLEAGYGQWGRKMQSDLADGVTWLANAGTIDPKRVCIVGGSYGGYAALAGVTIDQGVYRCAVSVAGVADLRHQVVFSREGGGMAVERYWSRFMGAKDAGDPILAKYSPSALAASASAPVLLVHGEDDTVVPIAQSREMAEALRKAGKPVEMVVLKSDDHWLSRGATRLQMLEAAMAFVERNNPPN